MFQKVSGIEKFYAQEGNITIFDREFVVSQNLLSRARNFFDGIQKNQKNLR